MMGRGRRRRRRRRWPKGVAATAVVVVVVVAVVAALGVRADGEGPAVEREAPFEEVSEDWEELVAGKVACDVVLPDEEPKQELVECMPRMCAGVTLRYLPEGMVKRPEELPKVVTAPMRCVVSLASSSDTCRCEYPAFDFRNAREELGRVHGLTLIGDSTTHQLSERVAAMFGQGGEPEELQALQDSLETMTWDKFAELPVPGPVETSAHGDWLAFGPDGNEMMLTVTPAKVCQPRCEKTGLLLVNWGLHMLSLGGARDAEKIVMYPKYPRVVAGHLLAHIDSAMQCPCPTFVAWRQSNVLCDRTNRGRGNQYGNAVKAYSQMRMQLNITTSTRLTPELRGRITKLAQTPGAPGAGAAKMVSVQLHNVGDGALFGTFDGFGTTMINNIATQASMNVHHFLRAARPGQSYLQFMQQQQQQQSARRLRGRRLFGATVPMMVGTMDGWVAQKFAQASEAEKRDAAFKHLPNFNIFPLSKAFCQYTENDARHYKGLQILESRLIFHTLSYLDRVMVVEPS